MGRRRNYLLKEPLTTISVYLTDAMLIDDFQKSRENRSDAHRRIFLEYFGADKVKEKQREMRKKSDRQILSESQKGGNLTIDNTIEHKRSINDLLYTREDLMESIIETKGTRKKPLAKMNADESIRKALQRGDLTLISPNAYQIKRKWF